MYINILIFYFVVYTIIVFKIYFYLFLIFEIILFKLENKSFVALFNPIKIIDFLSLYYAQTFQPQ